MTPFAYLIWDPSPSLFPFNLPLLGRPLLWYGLLFAVGFAVAYWIFLFLLKRFFASSSKEAQEIVTHLPQAKQAGKTNAALFAETLSFYVLIGALAGARLGDLLFYQDYTQWLRHPLSLIALWEGGLSSHGGAVGILCALWLFSRRYRLSFIRLLDFVVIPVCAAALFIRIGNFFNQEILGTPSSLSWAVLFLHPADGGRIVPRHPAQLYEAIWYLCVLLFLLWDYFRHPPFEKRGRVSALFLLLVFGGRFLIEFVKMEQSVHMSGGLLTMGQWLSIPFLVLGAWLWHRSKL